MLGRREFLKLSGTGLAGVALLGASRTASATTTLTSAPRLGISKDNSPSKNRDNLLKALTNSNREVYFPSGDYYIDNSGSYIVIRNFGGKLVMASDARFVFTDNTTRGLMFEKGSGARLYNLNITFKRLPPSRVGSQECILFTQSTDTDVRNININGSAAAGLLFGRCVRPSVTGASIKNTRADGLHFANCKDARAHDITTNNTGDDGLAFLYYGHDALKTGLTGGLATKINVRGSGARGISIVGQRDVTIRNFTVTGTKGNGLYCAREDSYNTGTPANARFVSGTVRRAGDPNGPGGTNYGICLNNVRSAVFSGVRVVYPGSRGVSGTAGGGVVRLYDVYVYGAPESGFDLHDGRYYLDKLTARNSGRTGVYVADSRLVKYGRLHSVNASRTSTLRRAFSFERNYRVDGDSLVVTDTRTNPTGYTVNASGTQNGGMGVIRDYVSGRKVKVTNQSRLVYRGPVQG